MHTFNLQKGKVESLCPIYLEKGEWVFIYAENKSVTGGSKKTIFNNLI